MKIVYNRCKGRCFSLEIQRKSEKSERYYLLIRMVFSILSLTLFLLLTYLINSEKAVWFDQLVLNFSISNITGVTYEFISFFTNLGSKTIVISIAVLAIILLWWKSRDYLGMVTIALVLIGSNQLFKILKDVFQRERPMYEPAIDAVGYSFPSGHSTVSMALYGIIIYFILKYMKKSHVKTIFVMILCCYIGLMGVSRALLQAHFISDVIAGFLIAFVYLMLCISFYEFFTNKFSRRIKKKSELSM